MSPPLSLFSPSNIQIFLLYLHSPSRKIMLVGHTTVNTKGCDARYSNIWVQSVIKQDLPWPSADSVFMCKFLSIFRVSLRPLFLPWDGRVPRYPRIPCRWIVKSHDGFSVPSLVPRRTELQVPFLPGNELHVLPACQGEMDAYCSSFIIIRLLSWCTRYRLVVFHRYGQIHFTYCTKFSVFYSGPVVSRGS